MAGSPAEPTAGTPGLSGLPVRRPTPKPIFVDMSGGRRRRLRILVAALVTPAAAYVALLVSTFLGGPTLPALLPHPLRPKPGPAAEHAHEAPRAGTSPTAAAATAQRHRSSGLATPVTQTAGGASAKAKSPSTVKSSPTAKPSPTVNPSPTATPSPSPTRPKGHKPFPHPKRTPTAAPSASPTQGTLGL
ncbi:hypothetical protein [Streptomyces roseochromogenus]|uniref:Uncharacterized protein n=1 Tax=Streptomyces roseochromogenus subsp. oscitans DS 12.976 TaxID=1352936 RepID=V6KS94_STRRC|nr:hypothetical protein [Streptomyces roseochromogenus]EST34893.1 hypothetical protein M878_08495 [Streptomyces roseochromogenus subsp. oscitans DS 12.976]